MAFLWLVEWIKRLFEFVPSCRFQWRLRQALHALIDLIEWTRSRSDARTGSMQTNTELSHPEHEGCAYLYFTEWSTFQVPLRASQPTIHASLCVSLSLIIHRHSHNDTINLGNVTIQNCSGSFVRSNKEMFCDEQIWFYCYCFSYWHFNLYFNCNTVWAHVYSSSPSPGTL